MILLSCHVDPTSGHMGKTRTINKIKDRFMWKGMVKDVQDMVSVVDVDTQLIFAFFFFF